MDIKNFPTLSKESAVLNSEILKNKIQSVLGYSDFKDKSGISFQVLVDGINRIDLLKQIEELFKNLGAKYDPTKGSSSVGAVVIGKYTIGAAPLGKQGKKSAGVDNENVLIEQLNKLLKDNHMDIKFISETSTFTVRDVSIAEEVGKDTSERKKSDVNLITLAGKKVPLSLKKDNAEMWESADSYWNKNAKCIVDKQVGLGKARLEGSFVKRLIPNIATKPTILEASDVVFGSDILENEGAVICRTFSSSDFHVDDINKIINVKVSMIYKNILEVENGCNAVYFLIRNDSSRKGSKIYPGVRVLAVGKSRISKNVLVV